VNVSSLQEIDEVFDKISYKKGASLIRMLYSLMGEQAFKQGIR
jgi:puromycin-sensitive aminopeptidase